MGESLAARLPADPPAVRCSCGAGLHPRMGSRHGWGWWELRCPLQGGGRVPRVHTPTVVSPRGLYGGFLPATREPRASPPRRGGGGLCLDRGNERRHPSNTHTVRALDPLLVRQSPGVANKVLENRVPTRSGASARQADLVRREMLCNLSRNTEESNETAKLSGKSQHAGPCGGDLVAYSPLQSPVCFLLVWKSLL